MNGFFQDIRYALRDLRKNPGFAAVAVLTLALGIGATTAVFSLMEAVMFNALPVRNPSALVMMSGGLYPAFQAFRRHTEIFTDLAASSGVTQLDVEVRAGVRERTDVSLVSGTYFSTLGVRASVGRLLAENDDRAPGAHSVAVASDGYWQRRFARDPGVIDTVIRISGTPITIVGVAPRGFFGEEAGAAPDLWVPLTMWGSIVPGRNLLQSPGTGWLRIIGRLQPGMTRSRANQILTPTFQQTLLNIHGPQLKTGLRRNIADAAVRLEPASSGVSTLRARFARPLQLLMGAVVLVLLVACANIAHLLLARAAARRREIALRVALGVTRVRLIRQLFNESLVLAVLGGTAGVAVAWLGREALLRLISADGGRIPLAVTPATQLLAFTVVTSTVTAILFSLAPAWQSAREMASLKGRHRLVGAPRQLLGSVLVVAQIAVSLVLLMGAGLFVRTIANLQDVELGFRLERLLIVDIDPYPAGTDGDRAIVVTRGLLERIKHAAGVASISLSEHGILMGRDNSTDTMRPRGFGDGAQAVPRTQWDVVGPNYFSTMGIALAAGRDFREQDDAAAPLVTVVNEEMARLFFGSRDPLGQRLVWNVGGELKEFEIIAVARDVKHGGPREEPRPRFYLPYFQMQSARPDWVLASTRFLVRTNADPAVVAPVVRGLISRENPRLSIARVDIGSELVGRTLVQERMIATLLVVFGVLAVGLACLGLYGLIAYQVAQRTSEIGIRMALGAEHSHVMRVLMGRGMLWIAAGIALGIPFALGTSRLAQNLVYGLKPTDPATLALACMVMAALGLFAGYIPARRAARIDPLAALRHE